MGWRGALRAIQAEQRRQERAAARRHREVQLQRAQMERAYRQAMAQHNTAMQAQAEQAWAQYQIAAFEAYIQFILSVHVDAYETRDWNALAHAAPPQRWNQHEQAAVHALRTFQPTLAQRALGSSAKLHAELEAAVYTARQHDEVAHRQAVESWEWYRTVAQGVLGGDPEAYAVVLEHLTPFAELEQLGVWVKTKSEDASYVEAEVVVRGANVIPKEMPSVARGKLSSKAVPAAQYWGWYEDHVCGAAIRVARELFAALPLRHVLVHVGAQGVNPATGHEEPQWMVSACLEREPVMRLNFERIDPSDALAALGANTGFKKKRQAPGAVKLATLGPAVGIGR
ncbi:MAG: hypothetical protein IPM79_25460 [Polyangiaceae bacterium]|jgi:hypothetical protein|nr:hypothetical protein [Polyangiaceae bacterium]